LACSPENSIVNSHIISSLQGHYGNYHAPYLKHRTEGTVQNIHPLIAMYWIYSLDGIYDNLRYDKNLKNTTSIQEIGNIKNWIKK